MANDGKTRRRLGYRGKRLSRTMTSWILDVSSLQLNLKLNECLTRVHHACSALRTSCGNQRECKAQPCVPHQSPGAASASPPAIVGPSLRALHHHRPRHGAGGGGAPGAHPRLAAGGAGARHRPAPRRCWAAVSPGGVTKPPPQVTVREHAHRSTWEVGPRPSHQKKSWLGLS